MALTVSRRYVDPFGGAKPRLSRRGREAPLRANPEPLGLSSGRRQAPAFRQESRRVDSFPKYSLGGDKKEVLMVECLTEKMRVFIRVSLEMVEKAQFLALPHFLPPDLGKSLSEPS
jgi:hypothetical protein